MYERIKELLQKKSLCHYIGIGAILIIVCIGLYVAIQSGRTKADSDYNDTINTVERIEIKQQRSLELNQSVQNSIDRSTELNHEAGTRIERIEEYQQGAVRAIDESTKGIDNAERLLERNQQLFEDIEKRYKEKP